MVLLIMAIFASWAVVPCSAQTPPKTPKVQLSEVQLDGADLKILDGHHSPILSLAVSRDGRTVATGSIDRSLVIWDPADGKEKSRIQTVGSAVTALAFSADGKRIATGGKSRDAILWNLEDGKEIARFPNHKGTISALALHANGRFFAVGLENGQGGLWSVKDAKPLHPLNAHGKAITSIAFAPKESVVAFACEDKTISLWNMENGKCLRMLEGHRGSVDSIAFDFEGRRLVSASSDRTAILWNHRSGKELRKLKGHDDAVTFAAFAADGKTVYTASRDRTFIQWDAASGKILVRCKLEIPIFRAAINPSGVRLIAAANDSKAMTFRTESMQFLEPAGLATEKKGPFSQLPREQPERRLDPNLKPADPNQKSAPDRKQDPKQDSPRETIAPSARTPKRNVVAFHPNGPYAVSAGPDATGLVWDLEQGSAVYHFSYSSPFTDVVFSPIGNYFAAGTSDGNLLLFESQTGKHHARLKGHTATINRVVFSQDGKRLISASEDRSLVLWNVETKRSMGAMLGHKGPVNDVAITPDMSHAISVSGDRTIRIWNAATLKSDALEEPVPEEKRSSLISLAIAPSSEWFAVGNGDKAVTIWDFKDRKPIRTLAGLAEPATCLAVLPGGDVLATGGEDGLLVFWDTKTWKPFLTFPQIARSVEEKLEADARGRSTGKKWSSGAVRKLLYEPLQSISISRDGRNMLTSGGSETLLWNIDELNAPKDIPVSKPIAETSGSGVRDLVSALPLGKELRRFERFSGRILAASPNRDASKFVLSESGKRVLILDAQTGKEITRLTTRTPCEAICFLPDNRTILAGGGDGHFFSINSATKKDNFARKNHTDRIRCMACTSGGTRAATGGNDRHAVLWDVRKGESLGRLTGHKGPINGIAINRDGSRVVTASDDKTFLLWDTKTFKPIGTMPEFSARMLAAAFSPDGKRFAVSSADGEIALYLAANGKEIARFRGNRQPVSVLDFFAHENFLLAGSEPGNVALWDLESGKPIKRFPARFQPLVAAVFSPDGRTILVADPKGVSFWEHGLGSEM